MSAKRDKLFRKFAKKLGKSPDVQKEIVKTFKNFWSNASPDERERLPKMGFDDIYTLIMKHHPNPEKIFG